ncbi:MAG: hypothetical protein U0T82_16990 [Bacteroidales bacterium]
MKKYLIVLHVLSTFCLFEVSSQSDSSSHVLPQKQNALFLEAGGYDFLGSIGYERISIVNDRIKSSWQVNISVIDFSISYNKMFPLRKQYLEFGTAIVLPNVILFRGYSQPYPTIKLGYRYQKPNGKFCFRAGLGPVILGNDWVYGADMYLWVWPCLDFGWVF